MRKAVAVLILASITVGCASRPSKEAQAVQAADERTVAGCTMLGEVQGSSGWGGLAASKGMQNARNEALESAAELGATHIVWVGTAGGFTPYSVGRAYKCR